MKKWFAGLFSVLLISGGIVTSSALMAQAHTGDLTVSYECDATTGEYVGTAVLAVKNTPLLGTTMWKVGTEKFEGTPSSNKGLTLGPVETVGTTSVTLGTFRLPGTTTSKGPWVYAYTSWTDKFTKGSDGQALKNLGGDCAKTKPVQPDPLVGEETQSLAPVCVTPPNGTATVDNQKRTWSQNYIFDEKSWTWVLGEKVFTDWATVSTDTVNLDSCIPPKPDIPDPTVTFVEGVWGEGTPTCEVPEVTVTRTNETITTVHDWVWSEGSWRGVSTSSSTKADETKVLAYSGAACVTEVTPTPEPTVVAADIQPLSTERLAVTGGTVEDYALWGMIAGGAMFLIIGVCLFARAYKR